MACGVGASLAALPHRRYRGPQTRSPARTDPREEGRLAHREGVSFRATPILIDVRTAKISAHGFGEKDRELLPDRFVEPILLRHVALCFRTKWIGIICHRI